MVTGTAGSLTRAGAAMADGFEGSSPRKPSAPSMSSKCSISAWSWPTAPSSPLPDLLLVPLLTWPCNDWKKGGVSQGKLKSERGREIVHVGIAWDWVSQLEAALLTACYYLTAKHTPFPASLTKTNELMMRTPSTLITSFWNRIFLKKVCSVRTTLIIMFFHYTSLINNEIFPQLFVPSRG